MSIVDNESGSNQVDTLKQQGSSIAFTMIPIEDRHLVRKHGGLGLQDYWLDCWSADPYGSRYVLMPDPDLKSSTRRKYRKQLKELGLFLFEIRQNGNNYQLWVLNRHGSRVKSYWEGNKPSCRSGSGIVEANNQPFSRAVQIGGGNAEGDDQLVERAVQTIEGGEQLVERGDRIGEVKSEAQSPQGVQSRSTSFQYPLESRSSSISPMAESGEEETENLKKTEEANSCDAIRPEGTSKPEPVVKPEDTSKPETVVEPESICTKESQASLTDKPETVVQPNESNQEKECSAAPPENENQSQSVEDAALLKWLVEVKLPSMELNEAPRNPEAYAKAMIRRDGDVLREEFAEVVRDRRFKEECAVLTEKVSARVGEWRQAGVQVSMIYDFSGRPQILLDGATIAGEVFLNRPIESRPEVKPISTFVNPDHAQNRKARQSRLKCADMLGECPGAEFLTECWGDVLLRSQVKSLIAKYPQWGIFVDGEQLQSWFDS